MEKRERQFIPGLSVLLLAILLFGGIGLFLRDARGVAYGVAGAIIWGGAVLVTFLLGTIYLSRRVLPIHGNPGWSEGFRLLWRNYLSGASAIIKLQKPVSTAEASRRKKTQTQELAPSFEYLGAGFLPSHQAAAVTRGTSYSRPAGPGLVFLKTGETVTQLFDLRPQVRKQAVSANTRDGIPIDTAVSVTFQVRRPAADPRPGREAELAKTPYPYSPAAIFDLNYAGSMAGEDERQNWTEQVVPQAAALLVSEVSRYTLDELLAGAGTATLGQIKKNIKDALERQQGNDEHQTLSRGIEILNVGVGLPKLAEDVLAKRLSTWRVEWQNRVQHERMAGEIEANRLFQQARARAMIENIENLLVNIDAMQQQNRAELHETVMTGLITVLEGISADKTLDPLATAPLMISLAQETSAELRNVMERKEE
jgi:hypothetical protein